eukprot:659781-Pyramimonas_sp.AAC.2
MEMCSKGTHIEVIRDEQQQSTCALPRQPGFLAELKKNLRGLRTRLAVASTIRLRANTIQSLLVTERARSNSLDIFDTFGERTQLWAF